MMVGLLLLLAACTTHRDHDTKPAATQPAPERTAKPAVVPAPPEGTILPHIGHARSVIAGDKTTAYVWKAVYEVDPTDAHIRDAIDKARADGLTLDAGDAGVAIYREEVRATGADITFDTTGFGYPIRGTSLYVSVRSDDDVHKGDPTGFTISVGPGGG